MATSQDTADYILDQLAGVPDVHARKMFGEYALYVGTKVVALICDDTLFVKITTEGTALAGSGCSEGIPYPGAKPYLKVHDALLEDHTRLAELILLTAHTLPEPRPKRKRAQQ